MRRRYQKPSVRNKGGYWIAQYRDLEGRKRKKSLGPVSKTRKYEAETKLAQIIEPINARAAEPSPSLAFGQFIRQIYLPFYRRKWKASTTESNEGRVAYHLEAAFEARPLSTFTRDELQSFLDEKASRGLSHSVVAHLRWDLNQVFGMAVSEGYITRNPATLLFVPREALRGAVRNMNFEQVRQFFSVLQLRERLIGGLAVIAGMRPGEIFALRRSQLGSEYADITQRVYRGQIDTPKTHNSIRWAALGDGLSNWLSEWLRMVPSIGGDGWVFPSDKLTTPLLKDNCWRRYFLPRLQTVGLEWANFQVMRRTHSCLLDELGIDPQVRADQMGHTVDVNQNKYTKSSLNRRRAAVNALEQAVRVTEVQEQTGANRGEG